MTNSVNSVEINANSQASPIKNRYFLSILVLFILPISGLGIDIYVPSLPAVSHFFGVDNALAQLTITAYMAGLGIMQLFAGPISDSYGRRKPFLIAIFLFILASLLIPNSTNIYELLALRFIQGTTVAVAVVPLRSIISDLFTGKEYYKMVSYMTMAWSIGPIIAPAIGGYLQHYFGWQSNFYFLAIYCAISFIVNFIFLPETSAYKHPFEITQIMERYKHIITHRVFIGSLFTNVLLYSIAILFAIVGPFLVQNVLHYSAIAFGKLALLTGFAWFLGSTINRFLLHIPLAVKAKICLWSMLVIAIFTLIIQAILPLNLYLIAIPLFTLLVIGGVIFPNNFARTIALNPKSTGSSNALHGGFLFLLTGAVTALGTLLKSTSILPLTIADIIIITLCLLIYYFETAKTIHNNQLSQP